MNRKLVKELSYVNDFGFFGEITFETLREFVSDSENKGFDGIEFVPYGYDGGNDIYYYKYRLETDAEYNIRQAEEEKERQKEVKKKQTRRKQYEKLKKEFESEDFAKTEI